MSVRRYELDALRILACLAVIFIHSSAFVMNNPVHAFAPLTYVTLNRICSFAVPCFIFISGFSLHSRYGNESIPLKSYTLKRLYSIIIPYLIWSHIYLLYNIISGAKSYTLLLYFQELILGKMAYPLYFIPIIIQFYILYIPLKWLSRNMGSVALTVGIFIIYLFYYVNYKSSFPYSDRFFLTYIPFFILGMNATKWKGVQAMKTWKQNLAILIGFTMLLFYGASNLLYYGFQQSALLKIPLLWLLYSVSIILFLYILIGKSINYLNIQHIKILSSYTMTVYFFHPIALTLSRKILTFLHLDHSTTCMVVGRFIMTVIGSFTFAWLLKQTMALIKTLFTKKHIIKEKA